MMHPTLAGRAQVVLEKQSTSLRCACGYGLAVELRREGERIGTVALFDDEPASDARGERVCECPGCGAALGLHALAPANPSRSSLAGTWRTPAGARPPRR